MPCTWCARRFETPSHRYENGNQYIEVLSEWHIPDSVSAPHTQGPHVLMFACVLVHHSDSGLGSVSRSSSSSMISFTMQISISLLSLNGQKLSAHIIPRESSARNRGRQSQRGRGREWSRSDRQGTAGAMTGDT